MTQNKKHIVVDAEVHKKLKLKSVKEDIDMIDLANSILNEKLNSEE